MGEKVERTEFIISKLELTKNLKLEATCNKLPVVPSGTVTVTVLVLCWVLGFCLTKLILFLASPLSNN